LGPIPWLIVSEVFSHDVKAYASSLAGALSWILSFLVTSMYSNSVDLIGAGPTFWIFGAITAMAAVFILFVVPETKGKTLNNIQALLSKK
jgi:hypothetical protein